MSNIKKSIIWRGFGQAHWTRQQHWTPYTLVTSQCTKKLALRAPSPSPRKIRAMLPARITSPVTSLLARVQTDQPITIVVESSKKTEQAFFYLGFDGPIEHHQHSDPASGLSLLWS
jgi:hypothetical protein